MLRALMVLTLLCLSACGGSSSSDPAPVESAATQLTVAKALFEEPALSASGRLACANCHADAAAHADPAGTTLPVGGLNLDLAGMRSSPSLRYLDGNSTFRIDPVRGPQGGFTWDGRADSRAAQAGGPLLNPVEMASADVAAVAARVRGLSYYADFRRLFGLADNSADQAVFDTLKTALQSYQTLDPDYALFNSRYDQFLDGKIALSAQEARGLAVFNNPATGNCASCHPSQPSLNGNRPVFTNFGYAALGVPRNAAIAANADPTFFDKGLCGPVRTDLANRLDLCGQFKIPTLRNIALTGPYFHNARVASLEDAVRFYATRDADPTWYAPVAPGVLPYDDLPFALRANVQQGAPFSRGLPTPRLSPQDVTDLVAFLRTLSDDPTAPAGGPTVAR
jgi:cytochrome c peroxidase